MSNSTHAHLRYNILDNCFRNKSYSFDELLEYVNNRISESYPGEGISKRTLREDLKVFRNKVNGFAAPLPDNIRILKYSDPNFSIAKRPLLEQELNLIYTAQQLLERFENHPKYNKLAEALIKFQDEEEQETDASKILYYDQNEEYKGIKYLKPLYLAIKKKQVLQITYKSFYDNVPKVYQFHPYLLKQYNRRWFVFGLNNTEGISQWSIPLDERLIDFNIMEDAEFIESETNWDDFFRTMVGVVRPIDAKIERVVIQFYNGRKKFFTTKPFNPDYEEFFEEEKQDQVWFNTIINKELVQQLLSYGKDVQVLEPEVLKVHLREHSLVMYQNYNK
ncbi:helix-turn-helix transcriptional regulator [Formosa maritima]|uniref:WYL domain-containing protein n=1 Tax=Formosa maritima TaxID=2592046 RepID=A0A5D0GCZ1_9FLAO|nr:WYL domain-containing protein [Formosa maritima]TYA55697.1 WYL domain-containing protein [Formosa maritima]